VIAMQLEKVFLTPRCWGAGGLGVGLDPKDRHPYPRLEDPKPKKCHLRSTPMKPMVLDHGGSILKNCVRDPKNPGFWGFLGFCPGHFFLVFFGLFLVQ
jgi:hypothetical protein